jgi:hypothetical protein
LVNLQARAARYPAKSESELFCRNAIGMNTMTETVTIDRSDEVEQAMKSSQRSA